MSDDAWTANEALSNLRNALGEKGMSIDDMFGQFDADSDGTINGPELHHGIRDNDDHRIDLGELRQALQEEE
jgi:Ca2+-binding EF-hand superfamily protein